MKLTIKFKGGPGSGHFDHAGRPGKVGGSVSDKGGSSRSSGASKTEHVRGFQRAGNESAIDQKGWREISWADLIKRSKNPEKYAVEGSYRLLKDQEAFIHTGESKGTGAYYGSSQIFRSMKVKIIMKKGDILHAIPGGLFVSKAGSKQAYPISFDAPNKKSPFERSYSGNTTYIPPASVAALIPKQNEPKIINWNNNP